MGPYGETGHLTIKIESDGIGKSKQIKTGIDDYIASDNSITLEAEFTGGKRKYKITLPPIFSWKTEEK